MTMTQPTMIAADHIRQLTHPYTTTEWVTQPTQNPDGKWRTTTRLHTVHHKPLLDQLEEAFVGNFTLDDAFTNVGSFGSNSPVRVEILDTLQRINTESAKMAAQLRIPALPLSRRLSAISGVIGHRPDHQIKDWWIRARIATQWETRPYQPQNAPCPIETCEQFGTLRVRHTEHLAHCTHCGATWEGEAEVQNLGRWVRWSTDHELKNGIHWTLDEDGQLIQCIECIPTRDAMTQRATTRHADALHQHPKPVAS